MANIAGIPAVTKAYTEVFGVIHESYGQDVLDCNNELLQLTNGVMFTYQGKIYPYGALKSPVKGGHVQVTQAMIEIIDEIEYLETQRKKAIAMFKKWYNACPYYELFIESLPPNTLEDSKLPDNILSDYYEFKNNPLFDDVSSRIFAKKLLI